MKSFFCLLILISVTAVQNAYAQQFADAKMNQFILMDKDENGMFEVFVNPMHFQCECEEPISILFTSKVVNKYISKDQNITIVVNGKKATVTVKNATECCILKAGIYSVD